MKNGQKEARRVSAPVEGDWLEQAIARGRDEAFAIVAEIGPREADKLLGNNPENRHLNARLASQLVRDIAEGRWQFNGESIVVANTGELNDGQHRLGAIAQSGKTVKTVIAFGVPRESRETLDMGRMRNMADQLVLAGIPNAALVSAITRLVVAWERSGGDGLRMASWSTITELISRGRDDEGMHESARYASARYHFTRDLLPGSAIGFCHYILGRIDHGAAIDYLDRVCIGDSLKKNDAAYSVRRALMMTTTKKRASLAAMVLRGWTFYRAEAEPGPGAITDRWPIPDLTKGVGQ